MKQELFSWLKDRKVFTQGGHRTLRAALDSQREVSELNKNSKRFGRRLKLRNKRNTREKL